VQFLSGVGPRRAELLGRLGIRTAGDLLAYLPVRHDRQEARLIENLDLGMTATIVGRISALAQRGQRVNGTIVDNTGRCSLSWFNGQWVLRQLRPGSIVRLTGKVGEYRDLPQMVNPRFAVLGDDAPPVDEKSPANLEPIYPATAEMDSRSIARLIASNLDRLLEQVREPYPDSFRRARRLAEKKWSLRTLHRPSKDADLVEARRRLAYDELLVMQIAVGWSRQRARTGLTAPALPVTEKIDDRIRKRFPFALTAAQNRAVRQIAADLAKPTPMNRLLQGDVGCGKTVVALYAVLTTVANKHQAAIMAPTELLAEQHFRSLSRYLEGSRVRFELLVGGLPERRRRQILGQVEAGELDVVVGTQALIQKDVRFARLGLVVVDEQHRFGVRQRALIRGKGVAPHYLVMTATPIPRTLAMTVFGDLDISTIDALPPGRAPTVTRVVAPRFQAAMWEAVRQRIALGEQAYVVYPLVEESEKIDLKAATTEYQRLCEREFAGRRVELLHGRMERGQREAVMRAFGEGKVDVLVSTTVIEVGIDVPNATCMIVEHADRFGLAQLHQLRGRVGRGGQTGYCYLATDTTSPQVNERLSVLAATTDGFKIAEEDLRIRGPGEMLGTRQHGLPELRVADLIADAELLRQAQRDAQELVSSGGGLEKPEFAELRHAARSKYGAALGLVDVG